MTCNRNRETTFGLISNLKPKDSEAIVRNGKLGISMRHSKAICMGKSP